MADSEEARLKAEAKFKKQQEKAREADKVWEEQAAAGRALDEKRARLKAARLAKEAAEQKVDDAAGKSSAPSMSKLAQREKERGLLPTHRPIPAKATGRNRKKQ